MRSSSILVLLVLAAAGCKKSGARSSCDAVGARFLAIAEANLKAEKDVGERERDAVHGLIAPLRDAVVKSCRETGWSAEARACMATAADEHAFRGCEARLTGEQRALLEQSAAKGIQPKKPSER